jgi:hypothetical protein
MYGPPLSVKENLQEAEEVCKNVYALLVEQPPGHYEDSRVPVLIRASATSREASGGAVLRAPTINHCDPVVFLVANCGKLRQYSLAKCTTNGYTLKWRHKYWIMRAKICVIIMGLAATAGLSHASTSFLIGNTGASGTPSTSDPNWFWNVGSIGLTTNTFVTDNTGFPFPNWIADNLPTYAWDSPQASYTGGQTDQPSTNYFFSTQFDLTGFIPSTAVLQFQFAVDNSLVEVILNGNVLPISGGSLSALSAVQTINSGFVAGLNTISFEVFNGPGAVGNPTGVLVDFTSATATAVAPEPSAALLIGAGLLGLSLLARRRERV